LTPVLVDTSAWRRFFAGAKSFRPLLDILDEDDAVLTHPFVMGELVLGGLSREQEELFSRLPQAPLVAHEEVMGLVRRKGLERRGIGWVDAHLLGSALLSSARLWTADKALARVGAELGLDFSASAS
jgi:predicted nucleic acid-binding protein